MVEWYAYYSVTFGLDNNPQGFEFVPRPAIYCRSRQCNSSFS